MSQKVNASMPPNLDLTHQYTISFAALDPASGAPVSGVVISNAQIHCDNIGTLPNEQLAVGPFMLVPGPNA